jgi:NAD(P)-dependent dehydrogenase (short-subunit alcohol dehydrogenase family)
MKGRVTLVSGGAQGIGRAIADRFQREGARVIILDCDAALGQATANELTSQRPGLPAVKFICADLRKPSDIRDAIGRIREEFGQLWALINNAAAEIGKIFEEVTLEDWDAMMEVNLRGAFLLTQAALPLFGPDGGTIVNLGSIQASHAFPESSVYACTKAALVALTRNLALELGPRRIRVNCICPGYIDTRLWQAHLDHSRNPELLDRATAALHPLGRRGTPADVAEAVLFVASDEAPFVNGAELIVDGGLTVRAHWPVD